MTDDPNDEHSFDEESELPEDQDAGRGQEPARHRAAAPASAAALAARDRRRGITVDPSLRIRDRWSEAFVIGTVLVFALIFFNALAFGKGGALTPSAAPPASVVETIGPSVAPATTPLPIPTEFQVPTHSPGPSASASPAAS